MKKALISRCEKSFLLQAISEGTRLDGRRENEFRELCIDFGNDWGCCMVSLGETKVLAQVSCEVAQPKATRPTEGLLYINVELSPMGAPDFELGQPSDLCVQLNRLLEKCFINSRSVDLESLCIVAEEKVWKIRVDVNVLNHEGNLVDAASIAVLTALNHFRRPDVTCSGDEITIHDPCERDPIPIALHHHPVCVSYALFNKGENIISDPTFLEERVAEAQIVFGMNAYREVCGLHLGGNALATLETVIHCVGKAAVRAADVVQKVKTSLAQNLENRTSGKHIGFSTSIQEPNALALKCEKLSIRLNPELKASAQEIVHNIQSKKHKEKADRKPLIDDVHEDISDNDEPMVVGYGEGTAQLLQEYDNIWDKLQKNKISEWKFSEDEKDSSSSDSDQQLESGDSDIQIVEEVSGPKKPIADIYIDSDEEEEETVTLEGQDMLLDVNAKKHDKRNAEKNKSCQSSIKTVKRKAEDIEENDNAISDESSDNDHEQRQSRTWYPQNAW